MGRPEDRMARLRLEHHFKLESLWLTQTAMGSMIEFDRDGFRVQIRIPVDSTDFPTTREFGLQSVTGTTRSVPEHAEPIVPVSIVQVAIVVDSDIASEDFNGPKSLEASACAIQLWNVSKP